MLAAALPLSFRVTAGRGLTSYRRLELPDVTPWLCSMVPAFWTGFLRSGEMPGNDDLWGPESPPSSDRPAPKLLTTLRLSGL